MRSNKQDQGEIEVAAPVQFLFRGREEPLALVLSQDEATRLHGALIQFQPLERGRFFWLETHDGWSMVLDLSQVQAFRFIEQRHVESAPKFTPTERLSILLNGRHEPLNIEVDDPEELLYLFSYFESHEDVDFPCIHDSDGDMLQINIHEATWLRAPSKLLEEGRRIVTERGVKAAT